MSVDAAPSGKAPPGRLRLGASTMALATAYPVAACGSRPHNNARLAAAGPHSMHAGERFLDPGRTRRPVVPAGSASAGRAPRPQRGAGSRGDLGDESSI
jgi:hypothetical protein